ncbi:MAG: alkaline phosphatase family protein [Actinomycetota bacterium]|nr:alkaline phosphatase family protein [Actinomycetota bacterium]
MHALVPAEGEPLLPEYGGACISSVVPAIMGRGDPECPGWLPDPVIGANQVVLLVLDGLGWEQLAERRALAPVLSTGAGGPVTSVVPSTTATALTSISTGLAPADHGVLGYRLHLELGAPGDRRSEVLNVLRWLSGTRDARRDVRPRAFQPAPAFGAQGVPVVTRSEFVTTGFSAAHLAGSTMRGWRVPSSLVVEVRRLLRSGEPFVYAYYDGVDKVAHEHGLGEHYDAELVAADRLVGDLVEALPTGAALVVVADHGQVEVPDQAIVPDGELMRSVRLVSGEGRFRWLHAKPGAEADLLAAAEERYGKDAWVRSRRQIVDEGWLGGELRSAWAERLGDVAIAARSAVAFADPADTGELLLKGRHGSLTSAEMLVPLLAFGGD